MKIPVSRTYIKQQLLSHPDYPSLLSITDTLDELDIQNTALQIEKEQLPELPVPFIAHLNGNGGEFAMIKNRDNLDKQLPGFFNRWEGIVLVAEQPKNWCHKQNDEWLKKDNNNHNAVVAVLSLLIFFIILSAAFSFSWIQAGLLLVAIAGLFISWMIVSKDLGIENKIADEVCGKDADCNSVIHSNVSKLPFGIGWSDAGIIYFSFLLLSLIISSCNYSITRIYSFLSVLSVAALPFTLISVYYQWRIIKKWCKLCLITIAFLWMQLIVLLPQTINLLNNGFGKSNIHDAGLLIFLLSINVAAWLWLKPVIETNKKLETESFAADRFRRNADIFKALLEKQRKLTLNSGGLGITLGNPAATNTIIKVCNPYCRPCSKAHPVIDTLLEENKNLKVQVIFTANDDERDIRAKPVKHLMALYEKNDAKLIRRAMDDWYMADRRDYDVFAGKYSLNGELERQGEKLKAMKRWCNEVKIEGTPTFFINGYELPKQYNVEELKYFLNK